MNDVEFEFPEGDQSDLESSLYHAMIKRAEEIPDYPYTHPWGEFRVKQGNIIHGVQWSYVGFTVVHDGSGNPTGEWYWEDEPDFEIDCSWHEEKL